MSHAMSAFLSRAAMPLAPERVGDRVRCVFCDDLARKHGRARRAAARQRAGPGPAGLGAKVSAGPFQPPAVEPAPLAGRGTGRHADGCAASQLNVLGPRGRPNRPSARWPSALRAALEGWEPYIWIVSDTRHQACATWRTSRPNCSTTGLLAEDYPQAAGRGPVWRAGSIVLRNGVAIEAFGTGQRHPRPAPRRASPHAHRLRRLAERRPHPVGRAARSLAKLVPRHADEGRHRRGPTSSTWPPRCTARPWPWNCTARPGWTSRDLQGHPALAGEHVAVAAVGGPVHRRRKPPLPPARPGSSTEQHRPAMDAGAIVLWPEEEDLYTLMCMRAESGRTAFEREKQNSPVNPELCEWPESVFRRGDLVRGLAGSICRSRRWPWTRARGATRGAATIRRW